jgi:hypothetical protein
MLSTNNHDDGPRILGFRVAASSRPEIVHIASGAHPRRFVRIIRQA